jgi:hypothetical protein
MTHSNPRAATTRIDPGKRLRRRICDAAFGADAGQAAGRRSGTDQPENYLLFTPMLHEVAAGDFLRDTLRHYPTLDLFYSRQIEQFLTLRGVEQIELLAAQVRIGRSDANSPMQATTVAAGRVRSPEPIATAESSPSHL